MRPGSLDELRGKPITVKVSITLDGDCALHGDPWAVVSRNNQVIYMPAEILCLPIEPYRVSGLNFEREITSQHMDHQPGLRYRQQSQNPLRQYSLPELSSSAFCQKHSAEFRTGKLLMEH